MPAQFGQATTQFRLKNHDQRDGEKDRKASDDPADDDEIQQLRDQRQRQKNDGQTGQHFRAASAAKIKIAIINPDAEQDDLDRPRQFRARAG